jgi:hypothetical protein
MNIAAVMDELLTRDYRFRERPTPLPGDARLAWRIATCLLILHFSRAGRAKLRKLHYLGHALRTADGREAATNDLMRERAGHRLTLRVEPAIPRALDFARGAGMITISKNSYEITPKGRLVVRDILGDPALFKVEKEFLIRVKDRATEGRIKDILASEVGFGA